jgi:hypothetical protein
MILIYCLLVLFGTFRIIERKSADSTWFFLAWALVASSGQLILMIVLGVFGLLRPVPMIVCAAGVALGSLFIPDFATAKSAPSKSEGLRGQTRREFGQLCRVSQILHLH